MTAKGIWRSALWITLALVCGGADQCELATSTNHQLVVGRGYTDVSPHQLVRTSANVIYTVAPDCASYPTCPNNAIHVFKAKAAGTPTGFTEKDAAHAPSGGVGSPAVGIDGSDRIHVIWNKSTGTTKYSVFDTTTDTWGTNEVLGSSGWTDFTQGQEGTALAIDATGIPHAVWTQRSGPNNSFRLVYQRRLSSGWETPIDVADVVDCNPPSSYCSAWHPTLAFAPNGTLWLAWLNGTEDYVPDGRIRARKRKASGEWKPSKEIPDNAMTGLDNGPSMIITPDGTVHLTFDDTKNHIRYWYRAGSGWMGDQQPPSQVTHDPSLGTNMSGKIYIYGHGTPQGGIGGHGDNMDYFAKPAGGAWGAWTVYDANPNVDSSVSTRWSQFFFYHPENVDILYWNDNYPNVLYAGIN